MKKWNNFRDQKMLMRISLKKERVWNTLRYRRSLAVGEEGT